MSRVGMIDHRFQNKNGSLKKKEKRKKKERKKKRQKKEILLITITSSKSNKSENFVCEYLQINIY